LGWNNVMQVIVVGHAGDPRQWQCSVTTQDQCARAFVMDTIVPADQTLIDVVPPDSGVTGRRSLSEIENAAGIAAESVISAVARPANHAAAVDPRLNFTGDNVVWVMRSLVAGSSDDATRAATVTVVDDVTGHVVTALDLAMATDYQPARIWIQATSPQDCCRGTEPLPFSSVADHDGALIHSGMVEGGAYGRPGSTRYGPGAPIVVGAGTYVLTAWFTAIQRDPNYVGAPTGAPIGTCSTTVSAQPLDDIHLQATFPADGPCAWGPAPSDTPMP
jgi:hypothetical protein